jgi:DNA-binding LytR/AlgR family response regulator
MMQEVRGGEADGAARGEANAGETGAGRAGAQPLRILIVDDEQPARERLRTLLAEVGGVEVAGEAANGVEALQLAAERQPAVVLLDVRMPGMDGVEAAHHLAALAQPPAVIFTTAYDEYAVSAFDAQAIGYLLKPVRKEKLAAALSRAERLTRSRLHSLAQPGGGQLTRIATATVYGSSRSKRSSASSPIRSTRPCGTHAERT